MIALFIVVLLNINSYAAVGANDGSAFVTKAEFDALVNTFNEQMDSYQSGLNSKIDGSIANYLAGLSNTKTVPQTNIYDAICKVTEGGALYWNGEFTAKTTTLTDYLEEEGEVVLVKMSNNIRTRVRVAGGSDGWPQYITKSEKGLYYYTDKNYGLKEYWKDVYIKHYCSGSISDSNESGYTKGTAVTLTCNSKTFMSGMTKYEAKSDTMAANIKAGSFNMTQTCNILYNLGLQYTKDESFNSGNMYSNVNTTTKINVIKEDEKDQVTKYGTINNKLGVAVCQYHHATSDSWPSGTVSGRPGTSGATGDKMDVYRPKSNEIFLTDLVNSPATTVYEQTIKITDGVPIVTITEDGKLSFDMTLRVNSGSASEYIKYGFKKNAAFLNNQDDIKIQDGLKTNIDTAVATHDVKVSVEIKDLKKDDVIWFKAMPLTSGKYAACKIENLMLYVE